ncbi:small multidrug efflux protein [Herbiconiux sp. CPCC 203407]|uniref:Small multidrug efflux protein n=1 Tax=Herbiconiux oxytropis TaxID=2970915 RepID=A0AA41XG98_9MICO|nr:small multidrug efflux protein [Herbiconiux oxytropis]MCS5723894.1 small multidrug efflux protein [Herbiconiux oxytropis]MCS5725908.1 small multidrug efflux protein [Herbiconiux oxytropis]
MDLIARFQELVGQVPELLQPLIVALAGAVPFIEGEGAATIGILGGLHPVVAVIAGAAGNFLCVTVLVLASSGARSAIVNRHRVRLAAQEEARESVVTGAPAAPLAATDHASAEYEMGPEPESGRKAARRAKFQRALDRYGVPGVSLLGPLLLPTQFTATMLAAGGVSKARVLLWQAVAIAGWTTIVALVVGGVVHAVV